ncbi:MAG: alanine--tRNA ligase [Alphaproteobacteria bacterium]|nr:alanine--tRNA ligase [Alphaproteobacteria bacterium]
MDTTSELRSHFLDYFKRHDHTVVPSAPLVPQNDPTLMFTAAGMVPFKNVFTGLETRPYTRAASSQKCVRAGGKHNDLENVGHTARHHTFFEMLGNFSFGDYFKEHAIDLAWNFFTKELHLEKERLWITVYSEDHEAAELWKKITGFSDERIIRISTTDNFWSAGDTGPCGPCSEIFYDHGAHIPGGLPGTPDEDGDRFVELWNLVFMQYQVPEAGAAMVNLPKPSIDTGSGLERLSAVVQGVHNNYDIDIFRHLIHASQNIIGREAVCEEEKASHRVIADHIRSSCFLIADGVMPSNEGRGYVLRRIMRRAMRHAHILGSTSPLMHQLVPALIKEMSDAYPELLRAESLMKEVLEVEETRFNQTLERGLRLLKDETEKLGSHEKLPGDVAFKLYDTFGFPLDLTEDVLKSQGRQVDHAGFTASMDKQKAAARASWTGSGSKKQENIWFELLEQFGTTEFLGYSATHAEGLIQAIVCDGQSVTQIKAGDKAEILVNQTPFYGESGGQMGDTGTILHAGSLFTVKDCFHKVKGLIVHTGELAEGTLKVGDTVQLQVDSVRRDSLKANHSGTHLLHSALRHIVGPHIVQKGSLVAPDKLRFDYSHNSPLTPAQITSIENEVNGRIRLNTDVRTRLMSSEDAQKTGAMALFGEKYEDEVRVVSMGGLQDRAEQKDQDFSIELCGGTHVTRTGDIGVFKILSDAGIAAGIRRIEAITGPEALSYMQSLETHLHTCADLLKATADSVSDKISHLIAEKKRLEKEIKSLKQKLMDNAEPADQDTIETISGVQFLHKSLNDVNASDLKSIADQLKKKINSGVVMVTSTQEDKVSVVIAVTPDLIPQINAVDLVRIASEALGGKGGGGRPDMAQAGGSAAEQIPTATSSVMAAIKLAQV